MTVTYEEASHCPRCGEAGNPIQTHPISTGRLRGGKAHILRCENERCRWYNTNWVVAVGANGEIPERRAGTKEFPALTSDQEAYARMNLEQMALQDPLLKREVQRLDEDNERT